MTHKALNMLSQLALLSVILIGTFPIGIQCDEKQSLEHLKAIQGPWANRLKCNGESPTSKKPFCLYTSSTFNHGGGISIITTEKTALTFRDIIQHHDPTGKTKVHLGADDQPSPELFYEIVNQPFKGNVLLAQKNIRRSKVVVASRPALIIDDEYMALTDTDVDAKMLFTDAVNSLPDAYMARVVRLKTYHGLTHWIEDIIKTNAFPIEIVGKKFVILFPEVSVREYF